MKLYKIIIVLCALCAIPNCFAQSDKKDTIQLVDWKSLDCDNTYDASRIKSRITKIEKGEDLIKITVNFRENCCADFQPSIQFIDDKLYLLPFTTRGDIYCLCDCCFSIEFAISGVAEKNFEIYFKGKKVVYSDNYYDTISPRFEMYKGQVINRINKYAFKEGKWMTFYPDSSVRSIREYPASVLYYDALPTWGKQFYPDGKLERYSRNDTVQEWFQDGTVQFENFEYSIGDTTFNYTLSLHDNRNLRMKSLRKYYPVIFRSKYNDCYEGNGFEFRDAYKESYYENGQRELLIRNDTTKKWYANGQLQEISFDSKRTEFDSLGRITEKIYFWDSPGTECSTDLSNTLYVQYDRDFNTVEIELSRDEVQDKGIPLREDYGWEWNAEGVLIKSPENWNEEFPWERYVDIEIP